MSIKEADVETVKVEELGLSDRVVRSLRRNGIQTGADLAACDRLDLWKLRGVGPKGRREIEAAMGRAGLKLRGMP